MSCARRTRTPRSSASIRRQRRRCPACLASSPPRTVAELGPLPCTVPVASLAPMIVPPRLALAAGRVRHVGDPVAFVVAETRVAARDAAELVERGLRELPSVVDAPAALLHGAPQLWDQAPGNLSYRFQKGDADAVRAAMAARRTWSNWNWSTTASSSRAIETARRDRAARCRRLPPDILRRRRACACAPSSPTACSACRKRGCACRARMSAAASA